MEALLVSTVVVTLAEIGDKTQLLAFISPHAQKAIAEITAASQPTEHLRTGGVLEDNFADGANPIPYFLWQTK